MPRFQFDIQRARADGLSEDQIQQMIAGERAKGNEIVVNEPQVQAAPARIQNKGSLADWLPLAGAIGGSFIPGVGTIVGGALGAGAGTILKQGIKQEQFNPAEVVKEAALGGAGGVAGKLIGAGGRLAGKAVTEQIPERLMNTVFKESIKGTKAAISKSASTLGKEALTRGEVGTSQGLYNSAVKQIDETENALQQLLMQSDKKVSISSIRKVVKPTINEYRQAGNVDAANRIENRLLDIEANSGKVIPVARANEIKRTIYNEINKLYGTEAAASSEGMKDIARGFKQNIEEIHGKELGTRIKQLNQDLSYFGRKRDSIIDKMTRDQRNNILGLGNLITGGAGFAAAGPAGLALPAIANVAGSTLGKTTIANVLSRGGQLAGKVPPILPQLAMQGTGQAAVRLPFSPPVIGGEQPKQNGTNNQYQYQQNMQNLPPISGNVPQTTSNVNIPPQSVTLQDGTIITPDSIRNAYIQDLQNNGGKNASKIEAAYKFLFGGGQTKPLTAQQQLNKTSADSGLRALLTIENELQRNPNVLLQASIPGTPGARIFNSARKEAGDVLTRLRTGAALNENEMVFYQSQLPQAFDAPDTITYKLGLFRDLFNQISTGQQGVTEATAMPMPAIQ